VRTPTVPRDWLDAANRPATSLYATTGIQLTFG
jgi:hypothetical protein